MQSWSTTSRTGRQTVRSSTSGRRRVVLPGGLQAGGRRARRLTAGTLFGGALLTGALLTGALLTGVVLTGCTGDLGATDGGVPVGTPRGTLGGVVVLASNPDQAVPGTSVFLRDADGRNYIGTTDSAGSYSFAEATQGPAALTASPPVQSNLAAQSITTSVGADSTHGVLFALASPAEYAAATGVQIQPRSLTLTVGQSVNVASAVSGPGLPSGLQPSLVITNGVGQVFAHNQVLATHPGSGLLEAFFGPFEDSIPVTVTAAGR